jgi:hypothetical protein
MRYLISVAILTFFSIVSFSQTPAHKQLAAKRTSASIKIDGVLDEPDWSLTPAATPFVESRPAFGVTEDPATRTEVYLLYDNTAIYVAGYCHERTKDSISKELLGRDNEGVNDYIGVVFDTYNDKINGFGFYITPYAEQMDAKYSNSAGEDFTWNAVWDAETKIVNDGWTFEMRIPYSAIRFVSGDNQTWGLNMLRGRKKCDKQVFWNPVDPKVNGFLNQSGEWTGIEKISPPLRLQFSPYFSTYVNHFPNHSRLAKDWTTSVNGGMDVKYGVSDAFTLDVTLIPDFGQVRSDNQVLNLSPFEVQYGENRPFFNEGTELFSKGNLFYTRRVGSTPINFDDAYAGLGANEYIYKNPTESKLINAAKLSGRTKKGLGLGLFNAITKPMYAVIKDSVTGEKREVKTGVLTNYNIVVLDQTLKNNSSISFINLNTIRDEHERDANVSAALFQFNNKKNTYNWNGKIAVSQVMMVAGNETGYSHNWNFGKTGGRWNFQFGEELVDTKYDINDMGIQFTNNYVDHSFWTSYRWLKPKNWYKRIQVNYNAYYSRLLVPFPGQKISSSFQTFSTNVNANAQLKNQWWIGMFLGYVTYGNDFYEPRHVGWSWRSPRRLQFNPWFQTNSTKKYYVSINYFIGIRKLPLFTSPNHQLSVSHRYRFSDKFSLSQDVYFNPTKNDAGYYTFADPDIIFSRRDRKTIENILTAKYNFNNKSGIIFRARHYWSKVENRQLYDLQTDGSLKPTTHSILLNDQNFNIFNIDATYTWQFAPGSFINIVWKSEGQLSDAIVGRDYFGNLEKNLQAPQNNNLSVKIIYFLDYVNFRKKTRKR